MHLLCLPLASSQSHLPKGLFPLPLCPPSSNAGGKCEEANVLMASQCLINCANCPPLLPIHPMPVHSVPHPAVLSVHLLLLLVLASLAISQSIRCFLAIAHPRNATPQSDGQGDILDSSVSHLFLPWPYFLALLLIKGMHLIKEWSKKCNKIFNWIKRNFSQKPSSILLSALPGMQMRHAKQLMGWSNGRRGCKYM